MTDYYRVDTTRMGLAELLRFGTTPSAKLAALLLWLKRQGTRTRVAVPARDAVRQVVWEDVPEAVRALWAEPEAWLAGQGLLRRFAYTSVGLKRDLDAWAAVYTDDPAEVVVTLIHTRVGQRQQVLAGCGSLLAGERVLLTSGIRKTFTQPPWTLVENNPGQPLPWLLTRHRQRLERLGEAPVAMPVEAVWEYVHSLSDRITAFHIARGVYVRMSEVEVSELLGGEAPAG